MKSNGLHLIKNVKVLRATYQIRLLASQAASEGRKLILVVPPACKYDQSLLDLIKKSGKTILREDY